jgi:transposase
MEKRKTLNRYSPEVCERAVRMVLEHGKDHASQWEAIGSIAPKIGCTTETLRGWVRQAERDQGIRPGPTSADQERIKSLERKVRELHLRCHSIGCANETLDNSARRMRSCARRRLILRWRSGRVPFTFASKREGVPADRRSKP